MSELNTTEEQPNAVDFFQELHGIFYYMSFVSPLLNCTNGVTVSEGVNFAGLIPALPEEFSRANKWTQLRGILGPDPKGIPTVMDSIDLVPALLALNVKTPEDFLEKGYTNEVNFSESIPLTSSALLELVDRSQKSLQESDRSLVIRVLAGEYYTSPEYMHAAPNEEWTAYLRKDDAPAADDYVNVRTLYIHMHKTNKWFVLSLKFFDDSVGEKFLHNTCATYHFFELSDQGYKHLGCDGDFCMDFLGTGYLTFKAVMEDSDADVLVSEFTPWPAEVTTVEHRLQSVVELTEEYASQLNEEQADPYMTQRDFEGEPLQFVHGTQEEMIQELQNFIYAIMPPDMWAKAGITELEMRVISAGSADDSPTFDWEELTYESSGWTALTQDMSENDKNHLHDAIAHIVEGYRPCGFTMEYNDGAVDRRSGYSPSSFVIQFVLTPPSAHETIGSKMEINKNINSLANAALYIYENGAE